MLVFRSSGQSATNDDVLLRSVAENETGQSLIDASIDQSINQSALIPEVIVATAADGTTISEYPVNARELAMAGPPPSSGVDSEFLDRVPID